MSYTHNRSILSLLAGSGRASQKALEELIIRVGTDPKTAWYPNSGLDFRDLCELKRTHGDVYEEEHFPDLFIHTDYKPNWSQQVDPQRPFSIGNVNYHGLNEPITAHVFEMHELNFLDGIQVDYQVSPRFVDFPADALPSPKIFLLFMDIVSAFGVLHRISVIYFVMESINFLDQVILRNYVSITHFVKVREGCGMGGSRKSITIAYAFARLMGTRFMFIDLETHTDFKLTAQLAAKHLMGDMPRYGIEHIANIGQWSGFHVNLFQTTESFANDEINDCPPDLDYLAEIIRQIKEKKPPGILFY